MLISIAFFPFFLSFLLCSQVELLCFLTPNRFFSLLFYYIQNYLVVSDCLGILFFLRSSTSVAPYLRKCGNLPIREILVIAWPCVRPPVRPHRTTGIPKKNKSTGMATQMQLEVILAGNRIATCVLWSRDRSLAETTKESIKTKTESGNCFCILVV